MLTNENTGIMPCLRVSHELIKLILYVINYLNKKKIKLIINSIEIITINIIILKCKFIYFYTYIIE